LRWAQNAEVEWSQVSLVETAPPAARPVRLATVHFRPSAKKSPAENCRMFAPLIADRQAATHYASHVGAIARRYRQVFKLLQKPA